MVDPRVKERLTGAIILVVLLVLVVPELLTGGGHSAPAATSSDAEGAQMRSYTIDLTDDGAMARYGAAPSVETPSPAVPGAGEAPVSQRATPAPAQPNVQTPPAGMGEPTPEKSSSGTASPGEPAQPPAASQPAPAKPTAGAGNSSAEGNAKDSRRDSHERTVAADQPAESGWAVQVGSFASRANAERLARNIKAKGFAATVSEFSTKGRRLWRVRVGPEPDHDAAVALRAKLRSAGYSGAVVSYP